VAGSERASWRELAFASRWKPVRIQPVSDALAFAFLPISIGGTITLNPRSQDAMAGRAPR
jgi:hypothetical protein